MGPQRAFALLIEGETFSAEAALGAGLVAAVVAPQALEASAIERARRLAAKPRAALIEARRLLRGDRGEILACIDREAIAFKERLASAEAQAAFAAFLAR